MTGCFVNHRKIFTFSCLFFFMFIIIPKVLPASAQKAIDFTLKDLEGKKVKLSDYFHKNIILIDFWATWCVPCIKEFPHFQKFQEKYAEKGLKIFAISVDGPETIAMVRPFMKRYKYSFPVLLDPESKVIALYNPRVILPYTLLIDWQGNVQYVHQGYSPGDEINMEEKIIELLEQKKTGIEKKFSYQVNEAFLNRNFSDKEYVDKYSEGRSSQVMNQLDLSFTYGNFLAGGRIDTNLDFSPMENSLSLAKRFAEWNRKSINIRAGDFYYSVGRGLLFSVLKTFEKEGLEYIIDTTVDGGKLALSSGAFRAEFFGGWIAREESDLKDKILGGTLGWKYKNFANIEFNMIHSKLEKGLDTGNKNVSMESVSLEMSNISEVVKFYGEFALVQKETYFDQKANGHGLYLESGFFLGNFSILLEFKDYKNLDFEYNRPPLLEIERLDIMANEFETNVEDVTGVAARLDYFLSKISALFYGKLSYFKLGKYGREITHFFGGIENTFKETGYLDILAGYRTDTSSFFERQSFHYQFNLTYPLTSRLSIELDWKSKNFKGEFYDYFERRSFISLHYSPIIILTLLYDRTNDPALLFYKNKKDWWGGQVELRITHSNSIRIFYGSMKGGVKCSGGICKFFPPFEGLRIDAIFRY